MLLTSVMVVLREVLEVALLLSVLLAATRLLELRARWFYIALLLGGCFAVIYGENLAKISQAFGGVGQELVNAGISIFIYILLIVVAVLLLVNWHKKHYKLLTMQFVMLLAVTMAIMREGSEIYVYLTSFWLHPPLLPSVMIGALLGAGIGYSLSALFYYLLCGLSQRYTLGISCIFLTILAAGMSLQASQLLIQADLLPAQEPLWDSSRLLEENSIAGQLFYAISGYEATPTPLEVVVYVGSIVIMLGIIAGVYYRISRD
ncbi:FTR1 family protein [Microbulbifer variabilis]|uniref:FTR1 family protein n=1 Tax=Microbulbifer variabilis TaxID=266805 RepID=UPI001CFD044D|nr:FTR1 family protein [Microbulbifer variabilis]